jgi:hypothetical protein
VTGVCRYYPRAIQINVSKDATYESCARSRDDNPSIRLYTFFVKSHKHVHYASQFCEDIFMSQFQERAHFAVSQDLRSSNWTQTDAAGNWRLMRVKALIKKWWAALCLVSTPLKRSEPLPDVQSYTLTERNMENSFQTNSERLSTICGHHYLSTLFKYSFSQPNISWTSLSITLCTHAREWKYISTNYKTLALDGGKRLASNPVRFTTGTHWIGRSVGPRMLMDVLENRNIHYANPEYWTMIIVVYIFS